MSKLIGKLTFFRGDFGPSDGFRLVCSYIYSRSSFVFVEVHGKGTRKNRVEIKDETLYAMIDSDDKFFKVFDLWSCGYKTRNLVSNVHEAREKEMAFICKNCGVEDRRGLMLGGFLNSDDDFFLICKWQYLFNISRSVLHKVVVAGKRKKWGREDSKWIELSRTRHAGGRLGTGRVVDSTVDSYGFSKMIDEETYLHNRNVAISRGFLWMFIDNEKMWCEQNGGKWNKELKEKALQMWASMR